ncbi:MAG: methyltransferase [Thermoplasmata archaeon]|nr:methyltransferase [Thermoplasmata archaeon]
MEPDEPEVPRRAEHYFTERPRAPSQRHELRFLYRGALLRFQVDAGLFASHGLDPGTAILIEALELSPTSRVLDLGCGWGPIGIAAAKQSPNGRVVMTDVNRRAVSVSRANVRGNRLENVEVRAGSLFVPVQDEQFDVIATNPPYHAGREVITRLLQEVPLHLAPGGRLYMVGKGSQGIRFYQAWLQEHAPAGVEVLSRGSGYRVLEARWTPPSGASSETARTPPLAEKTVVPVRSTRSPPKRLKRKAISAAPPAADDPGTGVSPDPAA